MDPEEWLDRFAAALGERPLSGAEMGAILKLARDVAHGVERKLAPLAAYLAGVAVGRTPADPTPAGPPTADRMETRRAILSAAGEMIPEPPDEGA
jgi:hypothetical protein